MKITFLTPGTGSYYCGACMRDNTLARELHRQGHEVTILPMYLPLMLDEAPLEGLAESPVFMGGINVYLQQKLWLFRKTPEFVDRLLNKTGLLRWAARHSHMTSARDHGEMTLEMLNIEDSRFYKEFEKMLDWLENHEQPDIVCLSNALLAGMVDELKFRLKVPVILFFQGEDSFLDHLPEPFRTKCWKRMAERLPSADALVAPSHFYGSYMEGRLDFLEGMIEVIRNGLHLEEYLAAERKDVWPTIGYMARMSRDKGLEMVVDAFIHLKKSLGDKITRLKIAGAATAGDQPFINEMKKRIAAAKLDSWVEWMPNISHEEKLAFLSSLMLFSVPATYTEAFGLYLVEAIACGVPVVQPDSASFPEIVEATGCGVCVPRGFPEALAQSWYGLLADTERRKAMSRSGRESVARHFDVGAMSEQFLKLANRLVDVAA